MKTKAFFYPYRFDSFLKRWNTSVVRSYCESWGRFLNSQNIAVPSTYLDEIDTKIVEDSHSKLPYQRWVLSMTVFQMNVQRRFEFHFFGGVLPSCKCGFVRDDGVQLGDIALNQILDLKLADVMELPVPGTDDEVRITGSAWALYLQLKLEANQDWSGWHWSDVVASSELAPKTLSALAEEFGQEVISFKYPSEIEKMNDWLARCDSEMKPQTEEALALLISYKKVSMKAWRKLRQR
jgi:hypothetical protein